MNLDNIFKEWRRYQLLNEIKLEDAKNILKKQ